MSPPLAKPTTTSIFFPSKPPPPLYTFLLLTALCLLGFFYALHHPQNPKTTLQHTSTLFLSYASNSTISSYLHSLTLHPHLAGTEPSLDTVNYVVSHFKNLKLETHKKEYQVLLSYPVKSSLSAHFSNGSVVNFDMNEFVDSSESEKIVAPYHAYSPSGTVHAKVAFVNYGREVDYNTLAVLGVNVSGCVVLVRKGQGLSRGGVVKIAESKGALAVLLYTEEGRVSGGVERGTVMRGVGDPLSPGWAGVEGGERLGLEDSEVHERDSGGRSRVLRVGPGPAKVNFTYQGEKKVVTVHNVFAVIKGLEEPDRYVILGNHRDAWTYGAVDPNSGTAALLDIARRYARLMQKGWNPRRTIILGSWDAEEFGMVGSTEWVEQNLVNLGAKAVAYLNVDCAVQGPGFFASATPQLDNLLIEVTKKVKDPEAEGATVYEKWAARNQVNAIQRLSGVDSDFAPFLQHAGIPSIDIYYGRDFPVYHTAFDSYGWVKKYADPQFHRHVAVAGIWGLLALHLADESILPFDYLSYVEQLQRHTGVLGKLLDRNVSLHPLITSIQELASAAKEVEYEVKQLREHERRGDFIDLKLRALNDRLMLAERGFLDVEGLQGRQQWFKHLIYGPPSNYESKLDFFPGIADALSQSTSKSQQNRQAAIQHEIWRVGRAIERAAGALKGNLT
ncbi:N-ACETYLATED-ALPHA-LINKED ACIDIC DIPEPTIDASE [Salix purpurea]|uniref:glutamate carboxypeptidase II n=1 Tax=Salix purpurea TaxID=77065 RepID=A0A9Q0VXJ0_SALPP|nr:N-ACETYLATED-ALPHA-LINKED ACIDIC DIPEPTIDASE [Salix purpurea]